MTDRAQAERAKYERMWREPAYRRGAPGAALVEQAIRELDMAVGSSVIDFGCGTGRPAYRLQQRGMVVTAVDHAENCLDPDVQGRLSFRQACLWDLPADLTADYGFCTDVMEHIPPDCVDATLAAIRKATRIGVFFQVATRPDSCGKLIGATLHLTVQPPQWWEQALTRHWTVVRVTPGRGGLTAVCR